MTEQDPTNRPEITPAKPKKQALPELPMAPEVKERLEKSLEHLLLAMVYENLEEFTNLLESQLYNPTTLEAYERIIKKLRDLAEQYNKNFVQMLAEVVGTRLGQFEFIEQPEPGSRRKVSGTFEELVGNLETKFLFDYLEPVINAWLSRENISRPGPKSASPIIRSTELLPALKEDRSLSGERAQLIKDSQAAIENALSQTLQRKAEEQHPGKNPKRTYKLQAGSQEELSLALSEAAQIFKEKLSAYPKPQELLDLLEDLSYQEPYLLKSQVPTQAAEGTLETRGHLQKIQSRNFERYIGFAENYRHEYLNTFSKLDNYPKGTFFRSYKITLQRSQKFLQDFFWKILYESAEPRCVEHALESLMLRPNWRPVDTWSVAMGLFSGNKRASVQELIWDNTLKPRVEQAPAHDLEAYAKLTESERVSKEISAELAKREEKESPLQAKANEAKRLRDREKRRKSKEEAKNKKEATSIQANLSGLHNLENIENYSKFVANSIQKLREVFQEPEYSNFCLDLANSWLQLELSGTKQKENLKYDFEIEDCYKIVLANVDIGLLTEKSLVTLAKNIDSRFRETALKARRLCEEKGLDWTK